MRVPILLILGLLIYAVDGNIVPNEALTTSLQDVWFDDEFVIAISNFNKRKSDSPVETLLSVKYLGKIKLVLMIDRRTKRVILESLDNTGRRSASHVKVDSISVNSPLKSLILLVYQVQPNPRVDVYVDCNYQGSIPLKTTFRHIFANMDTLEGYVEVLKERKSRVKVYQTTITDVLKKEQCPDNLSEMKQPSVFETPKTQPIDSDEDYQNKSIDRPDETSDEINGSGSNNNDQWPSNNSKFLWDKKLSNKKHPSDSNRPKKKDHSRHPKGKSKPDKYDPYDSSDPFSPSDETDNLDYPYGFRPPQSPIDRPKKHPKSDESAGSPVGSESFNSKRPGRSPYPGSSSQNAYPYSTDMSDSESSGRRVPRRGDIGIQSLDEKVCQTDDQIVKTLNELINATRKLGRELELNRMETQHLRHLIENCSACRTPIGE